MGKHLDELESLLGTLKDFFKKIDSAKDTNTVNQLEVETITALHAIQLESGMLGYDLQEIVQSKKIDLRNSMDALNQARIQKATDEALLADGRAGESVSVASKKARKSKKGKK